MKGKIFLVFAFLFTAVAVAAQFWPPERKPPSVTIQPVPGVYREAVKISLSSEPGASIYVSIGKNREVPYTAEFLLKRDATIRYYARDRFGNRSPESEARYEVRLDTVPPHTVASPGGGKFLHPVSVRLQTEEGARIYYTTDGSDPTEESSPYTGPIALRSDTILKFFALDASGNWEEVKSERYSIALDSTRPVTLAEPSGGLFNSPVTVSLSAEEGSTIYFTSNGSRPSMKSASYSTPVTFVRSGVLRFFAVDEAGNREEVREESYVIDRDPPTVTAQPNGGAFAQPVTVTLESSERGRIFYETGGREAGLSSTVYREPFTISESKSISYFALDEAGNRGPVNTAEYVIDTVPPEVVLRPPGGSYSGRIRVKIEPSERAEIFYSLDGTVPTRRSSRYEGPISIEKNTVLTYLAVDDAGNISTPESQRYILDSTAPVTKAEPPGGVFSDAVSVALSAERGAVIRYTLDGISPTQASPVYTEPIRLENDTVLKFFSTDESGNREDVRVEKYTFQVQDTRPPVTVPYPVPGEYNPPITLELRSNESATVYFTIDGTEPSDQSAAYRAPLSLKDDTTVKFFAVDRAGNREQVQTADYRITSGVWRDNTNGVFVHPSVIDGDYLWAGGEEGLFRVQIDKKSKKKFTTSDGLISNSVKAIAVDRLGFKWIGTDKGVSQFDGKRTWVTYDYSDGLPSNRINCIVVDSEDNLWFGTDLGLAFFDRKNFRVRTTRNGLPHNNVTSIAIDARGVFWIGTAGGLLRKEGDSERVFTTSDGLPSDYVTSVAVDGRWNIWVGTRGQGTARFDGEKWVRYSGDQGLPAADVDVIVVDLADNKWFGTSTGVFKYDGQVFTKSKTEIYR
jgi:sugar lactone lactonase YvrE